MEFRVEIRMVPSQIEDIYSAGRKYPGEGHVKAIDALKIYTPFVGLFVDHAVPTDKGGMATLGLPADRFPYHCPALRGPVANTSRWMVIELVAIQPQLPEEINKGVVEGCLRVDLISCRRKSDGFREEGRTVFKIDRDGVCRIDSRRWALTPDNPIKERDEPRLANLAGWLRRQYASIAIRR